VGQHGLPLLGIADWNEPSTCLKAPNRSSRPIYMAGITRDDALCDALEIGSGARLWQDYSDMKGRWRRCLGREWYQRFIDADGRSSGPQADLAGKIFLNGQTWPVISGFHRRRVGKGNGLARAWLNTRFGIKLSGRVLMVSIDNG
jgi:cellobiose phosphorylase